MKICFLSDSGSGHTVKWCRNLIQRGHEVSVISLRNMEISGVPVYTLNENNVKVRSDWQKLSYITHVRAVRRIIREIKPDILHAHYLTSYGLLGALSGFRPLITSVWGTDIQEFPQKSKLHEAVVRFNLHKADAIWATSHALSARTRPFTNKKISVTPFGVDMQVFKPLHRPRTQEYIIGSVKALETRYGMEHLIRAFGIVKKRHVLPQLKLEIAGMGTKEAEYRRLAEKTGFAEDITFLGYVSPPPKVAETFNRFRFAVYPSMEEAFGVATVEAQACGVPVIVSNVGGLPEVSKPGVTSLLVPPGDPEALARAMESFLFDEDKRKSMASHSRDYVMNRYEITDTFDHIENLYKEFLAQQTNRRKK